MQIACVMCLNLLIGAGSIAVIGRLLRDVQNASEAAAAIEALRKVEAIASVRLVELEKQ